MTAGLTTILFIYAGIKVHAFIVLYVLYELVKEIRIEKYLLAVQGQYSAIMRDCDPHLGFPFFQASLGPKVSLYM